jgi:hypothetical protein
LAEPITSPLRVKGAMPEGAFLSHLCDEAGCRLLVDVTALLIASRNHGVDAHAWLRDLPGHQIAATRIGGSALYRGFWQHDPAGAIDEVAWDLLELLLSGAEPEVRLLNHRERPDGIDGLQHELERLRSVGARSVRSREAAGERQKTTPPRTTATSRAHQTLAGSVSTAEAPKSMGLGLVDSERPQIAPDVALFVLDREGVFFSQVRHELTLFNTAATFVWCLLEEGSDPPGIAGAYAETFGVERSEADRHVGTVLRQWFGLGYLTYIGPFQAEPIRFITALAWLLTNPDLRALFRLDPAALADYLGVAKEDRDLFNGLDPDELEAQAEKETSETRVEDASRRAESHRLSIPAIAAGQGLERRYRLLTTTFAVRAPSVAVLARIDEALGHLSSQDSNADVCLDLRTDTAGDWLLLENDALTTEFHQDEGIVPAVKQIVRQRAVERHSFLLSVHAGVVAFGPECVLLPAIAGSGKTTLTAALVHAGATYFTDEIALIDDRTLIVTPVPLPLTVKDGGLEPLRSLYQELDALTTHIREDHVRVRYLPPPPASLPSPAASARARWIVFPRYSPDADTGLQPVERPSALQRLLEESYVRPGSLNRKNVESLVQWMRTVECYDLPYSSLEAAVEIVRALAGRARPDSSFL